LQKVKLIKVQQFKSNTAITIVLLILMGVI
jgi:hypothetical protein